MYAAMSPVNITDDEHDEGIVMSRTIRLLTRVRMMIAGSLVAGALLVPMSVSTPPAGALSNSPFCKAVFSWAYHPIPGPTKLSIANYHSWVKATLPYYEQMEANAPNAKTKEILGFLVTVLKAYANSTSLTKLAAYEKLHSARFQSDVKVLAAAIKSCATAGVITLP